MRIPGCGNDLTTFARANWKTYRTQLSFGRCNEVHAHETNSETPKLFIYHFALKERVAMRAVKRQNIAQHGLQDRNNDPAYAKRLGMYRVVPS